MVRKTLITLFLYTIRFLLIKRLTQCFSLSRSRFAHRKALEVLAGFEGGKEIIDKVVSLRFCVRSKWILFISNVK